jgi:hypothetical protein
MIFQDISRFTRISDYLPILNACLTTDLMYMSFLYLGIIESKMLKKWYETYQLSAVIADVLIIVIGIILARFFYSFLFREFVLWKFIGLAVLIQILHDYLFYLGFSYLPRGISRILDFFKDYAKETGVGAIIADSTMMISACILSSLFAGFGMNSNLILLIVLIYIVPYMIYV